MYISSSCCVSLLQTKLYEEAEAANRDNLQLIKTVCQALVSQHVCMYAYTCVPNFGSMILMHATLRFFGTMLYPCHICKNAVFLWVSFETTGGTTLWNFTLGESCPLNLLNNVLQPSRHIHLSVITLILCMHAPLLKVVELVGNFRHNTGPKKLILPVNNTELERRWEYYHTLQCTPQARGKVYCLGCGLGGAHNHIKAFGPGSITIHVHVA